MLLRLTEYRLYKSRSNFSTNRPEMNWRIFLLTSNLEAHVPYDTLVGYLRARSTAGRRFRAGEVTKERSTFYYGNVGSTKESLGYRASFLNEISIGNDFSQADTVKIKFRTPIGRKVAYLLVSLFVLFFSLRVMPEFGFSGAVIVIAVAYFGVVIDLNSQLYYFKDELESIENSYSGATSDNQSSRLV